MSARLVAIQGIGFAPLAVAVMGLLGIEPSSTGGAGSSTLPRRMQFPYVAIPKRRPKARRQEDILFL